MTEPRFNGSDYVPALDNHRLTKQLDRVFSCMSDGQWRTLEEIADQTGDPPASISAQLRHLRKPRFGSHTVDKRPRGLRRHGLYEYRLVVNQEVTWSPEPTTVITSGRGGVRDALIQRLANARRDRA